MHLNDLETYINYLVKKLPYPRSWYNTLTPAQVYNIWKENNVLKQEEVVVIKKTSIYDSDLSDGDIDLMMCEDYIME